MTCSNARRTYPSRLALTGAVALLTEAMVGACVGEFVGARLDSEVVATFAINVQKTVCRNLQRIASDLVCFCDISRSGEPVCAADPKL